MFRIADRFLKAWVEPTIEVWLVQARRRLAHKAINNRVEFLIRQVALALTRSPRVRGVVHTRADGRHASFQIPERRLDSIRHV